MGIIPVQLPAAPGCPTPSTPGTPGGGSGSPGPGGIVTAMTPAQLAALEALVPELAFRFRTATRKRAFTVTVIQATKASRVPFTAGRLASVICPTDGTIYFGGDAQVTADGTGSQGMQLLSGEKFVEGFEGANTETWINTASSTIVHVGCVEYLR